MKILVNFINIVFYLFILFIILLSFTIKPVCSVNNDSFIPYGFEPSLKTNGHNYTDIPHNPTLALGKFAIATWFKTNLSNLSEPGNIINKGGFDSEKIGNNMNYGIWLSTNGAIYGGFETESGDNFEVNSTANYIDNKWHYALLTYNGTFLRLDIDSKQISTKNTNGAIPDNTGIQPLRIGANSLRDNKFFTGEIDEVRIWNNGLTDVELGRIYNNYTFDEKNQISYLNFGENKILDRPPPIPAEVNQSSTAELNKPPPIPAEVNQMLAGMNKSIPKITTTNEPFVINVNVNGSSITSENSTNYPSLLYAILTGSVGAAGIIYMANYLIKHREEKVEISNSKINEIIVLLPIYGQLASNHYAFASLLSKPSSTLDDSTIKLCLYYVCNIAFLKRKLFLEKGGVVLGDLIAEKIIYGFSEDVVQEIKIALKPFNYSKMQSLVFDKDKKDSDFSFYEFCKKLDSHQYTTIYNDFKNWLMNLNDTKRKSIINKNEWFSELIFVEMNNAFKRWYEKSWFKKKPNVYRISPELEDYLLGKYREEESYKNKDSDVKLKLDNQYDYYYKRLKALELQFKLKQNFYDKVKRIKETIRVGR